MLMIQWDKQDLFAAPDGTPRIRYAISNREGVCCEMSMHDPTIQSLLAPAYWLPVFTALQESAKINRVDGRLVVLLGFGKPRDPIGNLIMMRVSSQPGFSPERMALVINLILMTLMHFGIRLDKNMENTIRGN